MLRMPRLFLSHHGRLLGFAVCVLLHVAAANVDVTINDPTPNCGWRSSTAEKWYWGLNASVSHAKGQQLCQAKGANLWSLPEQKDQELAYTILAGMYWVGLKHSGRDALWEDKEAYDNAIFTDEAASAAYPWCAAIAVPVRLPQKKEVDPDKWVYSMNCSAMAPFLCSFGNDSHPTNLSRLGILTNMGALQIVAVTRPATWPYARDFCRKHGGALVSLGDLSIQEAIKSLELPSPVLTPYQSNVKPEYRAHTWLGVIKNSCNQTGFQEGVECSWVNNQTSTWSSVLPSGQLLSDVFPDDGKEYLCISISMNDVQWHVREACETPLTVVCEAEHTTFDGIRRVRGGSGFEYLFFSRPANLSIAREVCTKSNATLVEQPNPTELQFVTSEGVKFMRGQQILVGKHAGADEAAVAASRGLRAGRAASRGAEDQCRVLGAFAGWGYRIMQPGVQEVASCNESFAFVCKREAQSSLGAAAAGAPPLALVNMTNGTNGTQKAVARKTSPTAGINTAAIFGICAGVGVLLATLVCAFILISSRRMHNDPSSSNLHDLVYSPGAPGSARGTAALTPMHKQSFEHPPISPTVRTIPESPEAEHSSPERVLRASWQSFPSVDILPFKFPQHTQPHNYRRSGDRESHHHRSGDRDRDSHHHRSLERSDGGASIRPSERSDGSSYLRLNERSDGSSYLHPNERSDGSSYLRHNERSDGSTYLHLNLNERSDGSSAIRGGQSDHSDTSTCIRGPSDESEHSPGIRPSSRSDASSAQGPLLRPRSDHSSNSSNLRRMHSGGHEHSDGSTYYPYRASLDTVDVVEYSDDSSDSEDINTTTSLHDEVLHLMLDLDPDHDVKIFRDKKLGHGGFGSVFLGEYRGEPVAIKTLDILSMNLVSERDMHSGEHHEFTAIKHELTILSRIQHPNVVKLYGGCLTPPKVMIVMEVLDCSLADYMQRAGGALPLRTTLQIIRAVAAGIAHLHPEIIHRDLKPQNILLDKKGHVKITDFGVSRIKQSTYLKTEHQTAGTIPYMSPECYQARTVTEKCDIYSLGVILWQCLTGKVPWEGWNGMAVMYQVGCLQARLPLNDDLADVPPCVTKLISRCWAQCPPSRPSAREVVKEVNAILETL